MAQARTRGRLATRIVRLTTALVGGAILLIVVLAGVAVSEIVAEAARSRDLLALQAAEDMLGARLRSVTTRVGQATVNMRSSDVLFERLRVAHRAEAGAYLRILVADPDGGITAAVPAGGDNGWKSKGHPAFEAASKGRIGFVTAASKTTGQRELWYVRTVIPADSSMRYVLVEVSTDFVDRALASLAESDNDMSGLLMDGDEVFAATVTGKALRIDTAVWSERSDGTVRLSAEDGTPMQGHFSPVQSAENLDWRIVMAAPASRQPMRTVSVVAPIVAALLLLGLAAVAAAWFVANRLSAPLKELERAALKAASGSYTHRVVSVRDDEIGRVGDAFNAVAIRLNALQDVSRLLASTSSLDQVLSGILAATEHLVGPGASVIYLLEGGVLRPAAHAGLELSEMSAAEANGRGWLSTVMRSMTPVVLHSETADVTAELPGIRPIPLAIAGAALVSGNERLGVVVVARDRDRPFDDAELQMLHTFSSQAAVAVQTSRLFEEESYLRRTAEAMRAVAEQLVGRSSLQSALTAVEHIVTDISLARQVKIALVDPRALGLSEQDGVAQLILRVTAQEVGVRVADIVPNLSSRGGSRAVPVPRVVSAGDSHAADELLAVTEADHCLLVPAVMESGHGAVMAVATDAHLETEIVEFCLAVADEVALALDSAYNFQRALTRAGNLEKIFSISQAVGSSLEINIVLNRVLDVVQKILSADAVVLMSYDSARKRLATTMGRGLLPSEILTMELQAGVDIPGRVFASGEPVSEADLSFESGALARAAQGRGLHSLLAVPLLARGRSIGVLMVLARQRDAFSDEDVNTLRTFGSQASLAIDTARMYGREHESATILRESILPEELPTVESLDLGSVYAPAGSDAEIGGDYYDVVVGADGRIWLAIADVCGKGVYAATKTSMIKYALRALSTDAQGPGDILERLNDMIADTGDASAIVTLWLGCYDPTRMRLVWANGGHPPGILRRASDPLVDLGVTGPVLGAMRDITYEERETTLRAGDRIVLYTDGVTESRRGGEFFGEGRVHDAIGGDGSASQTAASLMAAVREYVQGELRDDVAVLVAVVRNDESDSRKDTT